MRIKKVKFKDIKTTWRNLFNSNEYLSPYSSIEFNEIFYKNYRFGLKRVFLKTAFYEVIDDDENIIMIIPLFGNNNKFYIFGDLASTGYLDFIYKSNYTNEKFNEAFKLLGHELKGCILILNKINEKSKLNDYLASNYTYKSKNICVNIAFGSDYNEYLQGLRKSIRHKLRTISNRLERDGLNYRVEVRIDKVIPRKLRNEMLKVYNQRLGEKCKVKEGFFTKLIRGNKNPITISTGEMNGNFNSLLWINDSLAAFLSGYVNKDNISVILPRHAINVKYSLYSPGYLLISETIKWLIQNTDIRNLDTSRGNEQYKYFMGGSEHYNYSYEIDF